jgi:hypothetical protein
LPKLTDFAGNQPELEKQQAFHQVTEEIKPSVAELRSELGEVVGGYQQCSEDDQSGAKELRPIESIDDGDDEQSGDDEQEGAPHVNLR